MTKKTNRSKTPEESVAEPTWSLRPKKDDPIRELVAQAMHISGKSRNEVILDIAAEVMPDMLKRMLDEKRKQLDTYAEKLGQKKRT